MSGKRARIFSRSISRDQAKDTGMAFVLICLLLTFFLDDLLYSKIAIALLIIDMIAPATFRYPAFLWLGLSHMIGAVVSKVLLTAVFFVIVTPVGLFRRLLGFDSMKIRGFGKDSKSVMIERNRLFTGEDLEKPY